MKKQEQYGNSSISMLKGEDRVRKRPAVIFGSDDLEGCKHAVFEILSNAIDEAREGYGDTIIVTRYEDLSVEVEDFGRGCPVDYNEKEKRYNWELVFCEMYAGGKYGENGENYEYSLGLNGLGSCATQYASEFFDATIRRDGYRYDLHFEKGRNKGGLKKEPADRKKTGSCFHWKPDKLVFTDINIPVEYYRDVLRRQAVVNKGITFRFRNQVGGKFETEEFCYADGIRQYIEELVGDNAFTMPVYWEAERRGRDAENRPEMKLKITASFCFSKQISHIEYYHNSSWLEYGGSPDKAVRSGFTAAFDKYLRDNNKYTKNENKIIFQDIQDSLVLVTNCFSTIGCFENQTKKSVNSKFTQDAMTAFFKEQLQVWFIENKQEADKASEQILVNKRARESAEKTKSSVKKKLSGSIDIANRVEIRGLPQPGRRGAGAVYRGGRFRIGQCQAQPGRGISGHHAGARQNPQLPESRLRENFRFAHHHRPDEGPGLRRGGAGQEGKGTVVLRPFSAAVEQGGYLYGCGRGRLSDPDTDPDHALPPVPDADPGRICVYRGVAAVRDHLQGQDMVCLQRAGEDENSQGIGRQKNHHPALQRSRRKRPGDDVDDHHESGDPPPHQGHAGGRGAHGALF